MCPIALSRRKLLHVAMATGAGILTGAGAYGAAFERHRIAVTRATIPFSGLPRPLAGLRIGLITDLHHSDTVSAAHVTEAVTLLQRERPDLIVLGGDYITSFDRRFVEPVAERLAPLSAPHGVFAILGNHDDDRRMPAALVQRRFVVLRDERTQVRIKGEALDIAGIRFWTRDPAEIARVVRGATGPLILLAHDPRRLVEAAALDVGLLLSGHTHGGQIVLPLVGPILPRDRRLPVVAGLARHENTSMFISRGVGTVYLPIRLNCPPEVAILTLERHANF